MNSSLDSSVKYSSFTSMHAQKYHFTHFKNNVRYMRNENGSHTSVIVTSASLDQEIIFISLVSKSGILCLIKRFDSFN